MSPLSLPLDSCRSIPLMSYVHDPNFISHSWSSNYYYNNNDNNNNNNNNNYYYYYYYYY